MTAQNITHSRARAMTVHPTVVDHYRPMLPCLHPNETPNVERKCREDGSMQQIKEYFHARLAPRHTSSQLLLLPLLLPSPPLVFALVGGRDGSRATIPIQARRTAECNFVIRQRQHDEGGRAWLAIASEHSSSARQRTRGDERHHSHYVKTQAWAHIDVCNTRTSARIAHTWLAR